MATDHSDSVGKSEHSPDSSEADADFLKARRAVYTLLANVFDGDVDALATAMADGSFERLAGALPVQIDVDPLVADAPETEALAVGYDNLFVVPGPHFVPPFASGHATDPSHEFESDSAFHEEGTAGELLGDPAASMAQRYDRVGFSPQRGDGIPDHIAAQLSFLATLADQRIEPGDPDVQTALRDIERDTLGDMGWLDAFDEAVAARDQSEGVYAALTRLTRSIIAWDADRNSREN
jgi:TorA maturation chaperone TorD